MTNRTGSRPPAPDEAALQRQLGASYAPYREFLDAHPELRPEWKYYGAKSGWSLKLFAGKRNLCFVIPHEGHFTVAFALGARAVSAAASASLPESVKAELRSARAYVEGTPVRIAVRGSGDLVAASVLLEIKRTH